MSIGVVYLLTNPQLAARLVVSVYSLRKWYDGPVTVFTTRPESHEIGQLLQKDKRVRIEHRTAQETAAHNNFVQAYLTKVDFLEHSPYDATVFLDADTLVVGRLDELLTCARTAPITATIYGPLQTHNRYVNHNLQPWKRLLRKHARDKELAALVTRVLTRPQPIVNAGVFAIQKDASMLNHWRHLSWIGREMPTPEEGALQILLLMYPNHILGAHYNCLPIFASEVCDVRIWHFAASTHLRLLQGRQIWLPAYEECCRLNIAKLRRWSRVELTSES
jgi:hypothetical protein